MTPELKIACEVVFQEHKTSLKPVTWNKDVFLGRLPFGLSAMAKEILLSKNIICFPNPEKKIFTRINPAAITAANFEEADDMVRNKVPAKFTTTIVADKPAVIINTEPAYTTDTITQTEKKTKYRLVRVTSKPETVVAETIWYTKPLFVYLVWPASAAIGGAFITWFLGSVYTKIFF